VFHSPEGKNLNSRGWQPTDRYDKWVTPPEGSNKSIVMCCSTPSGSVSISPFAPWVTPTATHIQPLRGWAFQTPYLWGRG